MSIAPNPVKQSAQIKVFFPKQSAAAIVDVLDMSGKVIKTIWQGSVMAGERIVHFDAGDIAGGAYWCRVRTGSMVRAVKWVKI